MQSNVSSESRSLEALHDSSLFRNFGKVTCKQTQARLLDDEVHVAQ